MVHPLPKDQGGPRAMLEYRGYDQFNRPAIMILPASPPLYYFWLGADAYPGWPEISSLDFTKGRLHAVLSATR